MQVLTLAPEAFDRHAEQLAQMVAEEGPMMYDAIVSVRRVGSFVCYSFCRHFPKERYGERYDVKLQRPSTKHKNGKLNKLLKHLPTSILNLMRMAESNLLLLRSRTKGHAPASEVELPCGLVSILREAKTPQVLVIDDAIDSGDTLFSIAVALKGINPEAEIRIAVMTETTGKPRIHANFTLYRNKTLIRFPWSNDYKHH